jgi:hypothetical protein
MITEPVRAVTPELRAVIRVLNVLLERARTKSISGVGQDLFHLGGAGHVPRCHPAAVRRAGIGPVPDEKPDDLELLAVDGPAQRRLPLGVASVKGCAMVEQRLRYRNVATARGLM